MSRCARIFRRLESAGSNDLGGVMMIRMRPSTRKRTRSCFSPGSMWMSLAFSFRAWRMIALASFTAGASSPPSPLLELDVLGFLLVALDVQALGRADLVHEFVDLALAWSSWPLSAAITMGDG